MFNVLVYSMKPWTNGPTLAQNLLSPLTMQTRKRHSHWLHSFTQGFVSGFACDFKQCKQMCCTEELPKAKANQLLQSITLLSKKTQA